MKRFWLVAVLATAAAFAFGSWYYWGPASVPSGQPPLTEISQQNYAEFREAFNAAADQPRIVALLSPT